MTKILKNEKYERIKEIKSPYVAVLGAIGRLHGYFESHIAGLKYIVTREQAADLVRKPQDFVDCVLQPSKESIVNTCAKSKTNTYTASKEIAKTLVPIDGLIVVGLIHEQEKILKKLLLSKQSKDFFCSEFSDENKKRNEFMKQKIKTNEKSKEKSKEERRETREKIEELNKKIENLNLSSPINFDFIFTKIIKKFNLTEEIDFVKIIKNCNSYSNCVKHGDHKKIDNLEKKMKKEYGVSPIVETEHIGQIVLWQDLFVFYVKSLECFWLYIFNNLCKPTAEEQVIYCDVECDGKIYEKSFDVNKHINDLRDEFCDKINGFWQGMNEEYSIKTDPVKLIDNKFEYNLMRFLMVKMR